MPPFFDERTLYDCTKRPSWRKMALWWVGGIIFGLFLASCSAHAQTAKKLSVGDSVVMRTAFCANQAEAQQLMDALKKGGYEQAAAYMDEDDNTCAVATVPIIVGEAIGSEQVTKDGTFIIVKVTAQTGDIFAIMLSRLYSLTSL